jgi:hypothetical protein
VRVRNVTPIRPSADRLACAAVAAIDVSAETPFVRLRRGDRLRHPCGKAPQPVRRRTRFRAVRQGLRTSIGQPVGTEVGEHSRERHAIALAGA